MARFTYISQVTLGLGESAAGLADLHLPDILHRYMTGGRKEALTGPQREKYRFQSFQVREGETGISQTNSISMKFFALALFLLLFIYLICVCN